MTPITREQARELAETYGVTKKETFLISVELFPALLTDFRQQVIADLARGSGAVPIPWHTFDGEVCNAQDARESIASLQAKLEQSEARAQKIREAVDDAAYEWSQYVEVDRAPMTLQKYIVQAIDAALNKEPGHEA